MICIPGPIKHMGNKNTNFFFPNLEKVSNAGYQIFTYC